MAQLQHPQNEDNQDAFTTATVAEPYKVNATERKKKGLRQTITPDEFCAPYLLSGGDVSATYVHTYIRTYVHTHINHQDMKFTADGKGRVNGEKT